MGEPGIGKSRLANEVVASIGDDAHSITLRCAPPSDGIGFFPVRQAVIEAAGVHGWKGLHELLTNESAVQEVAAAIGRRSPPATVDELNPPMRRLLEALAREHPMIIVFDELHWADPAFLEVVDRLEREARGFIFVICLTRPDLLEDRIFGDVVRLEPLSASEVARLVIDRGGPAAQGPLQSIVNRAQGNPLFAEQLLAAVDDGDIDAIPPSLVGLLSMRLDRLGPGERDVLRCASIGGLDLDPEVILALLPSDARPFVERHLATLERKRLIEHLGPGRFRFAHPLVQMAAYQSMTHEDRARLHEIFAERLRREGSDESVLLTDTTGYHLRRAVEHRQASGAPD